MFPTSNSENPNFIHSTETLLKPPLPYDQNPSSTLEDPPFLYFPSPFLDDHDVPLTQIFSHQQHQELLQATHGKEPGTLKSSSLVTTKKRGLSSKPRKRTGKTDRHSKIRTAQGVRDRRMRLSVQIARKFFDLQDMLGFDKASKTIEWLFSNSKNAIKELSKKRDVNTSSSTECDRVSTMEDCSKFEVIKEKAECNLQARETREKARARARERTKEKMMIKQFYESNPNSLEQLGFSNPNPFLEESNSYTANIIQEKSSPLEASYSIASIFDCYQNIYAGTSADTDSTNSFMGNFLGNWELDNDVRTIISPFSGIVCFSDGVKRQESN